MRISSYLFSTLLGLCLTAFIGYMTMVTLRFEDEGAPPTVAEWFWSAALDSLPFRQSNKSSLQEIDGVIKVYRRFDADMRFGQLSVSGAAMSFFDFDDPTTFAPYNFSYRHDRFVPTPTMNFPAHDDLYRRIDVTLSKAAGVIQDTCINPRPEKNSTASGLALKNPLLCHLQASLPDHPPAMIGVIQPVNNVALVDGGDAVCRAELNHWITLPTFESIPLVFCIIVDRPFDQNAYTPELWMDVIIYQRTRRGAYTARATRRNF